MGSRLEVDFLSVSEDRSGDGCAGRLLREAERSRPSGGGIWPGDAEGTKGGDDAEAAADAAEAGMLALAGAGLLRLDRFLQSMQNTAESLGFMKTWTEDMMCE